MKSDGSGCAAKPGEHSATATTATSRVRVVMHASLGLREDAFKSGRATSSAFLGDLRVLAVKSSTPRNTSPPDDAPQSPRYSAPAPARSPKSAALRRFPLA